MVETVLRVNFRSNSHAGRSFACTFGAGGIIGRGELFMKPVGTRSDVSKSKPIQPQLQRMCPSQNISPGMSQISDVPRRWIAGESTPFRAAGGRPDDTTRNRSGKDIRALPAAA